MKRSLFSEMPFSKFIYISSVSQRILETDKDNGLVVSLGDENVRFQPP